VNAADQLRAVVSRLSDYRDLLPKLGEFVADTQRLNIEQSRTPSGVPYRPLAASTLKARGEGHPYGDKPLLDTTNMYQSIHFREIDASSVFAGPSIEQADYFPNVNQGTDRIPARTFIGLRPEDRPEIRDILSEWIVGQLAR
jgi:phage gpG-like protein